MNSRCVVIAAWLNVSQRSRDIFGGLSMSMNILFPCVVRIGIPHDSPACTHRHTHAHTHMHACTHTQIGEQDKIITTLLLFSGTRKCLCVGDTYLESFHKKLLQVLLEYTVPHKNTINLFLDNICSRSTRLLVKGLCV